MSQNTSAAVSERTQHAVPTNGAEDRTELRRRVVRYLDQQGQTTLRGLEVDVVGQIVTLRGRVRSFYAKQLALNCCQRVAGVQQVVDLLGVDANSSR